jgi:hypothetical protein
MNRKTDNASMQRWVDAAAGKLLAAGIRPTVALVHEAVGGSARNLRPLLEDWRMRLAARQAAPVDLPATAIPEERAEAVVRQAIDSARGSLRKRMRTTQERLSTLAARAPEGGGVGRAELEQILRDLVDLQRQIGAHANRLDEMRVEFSMLEKRVEKDVRALRLLSAAARARDSKGRR